MGPLALRGSPETSTDDGGRVHEQSDQSGALQCLRPGCFHIGQGGFTAYMTGIRVMCKSCSEVKFRRTYLLYIDSPSTFFSPLPSHYRYVLKFLSFVQDNHFNHQTIASTKLLTHHFFTTPPSVFCHQRYRQIKVSMLSRNYANEGGYVVHYQLHG